MRINEPINYANHCPRRLRPLPKIFFIGLTTWPRLFWEIGASTFAGAATPLNFLGRPYPTSYVYSRQFSRRPWITKEYHIRSPGWRISHFQGALAHPIAFGCSELCQGLGLVMLGCSFFCFGERHGSQMMSVESVDKVDNSASSSIGFTSFYFHFQWTCIYNSLISDRGSANVLSETNCPGGCSTLLNAPFCRHMAFNLDERVEFEAPKVTSSWPCPLTARMGLICWALSFDFTFWYMLIYISYSWCNPIPLILIKPAPKNVVLVCLVLDSFMLGAH